MFHRGWGGVGLIATFPPLVILVPRVAHAENTFLNSPGLLNYDFSMKKEPRIYFAGQISGVEGYMESASSGILAGYNAARRILGEDPILLPKITMMGALSQYISDETVKNFQPMGAAFGIIDPLDEKIRDKKERYEALANRSLDYFKTIKI